MTVNLQAVAAFFNDFANPQACKASTSLRAVVTHDCCPPNSIASSSQYSGRFPRKYKDKYQTSLFSFLVFGETV
jgi:hypothetical protein